MKTKIEVTNHIGHVYTFSGDNLKIFREGNSVDIYKHTMRGNDFQRINLGSFSGDFSVVVLESPQEAPEKTLTPEKRQDPFTKKALLGKEGTDEEKDEALDDLYRTIKNGNKEENPSKRKRRTKAEMELERAQEIKILDPLKESEE